MNSDRASQLSAIAMDVHVMRRARELQHQAPSAELPYEIRQLHDSAAQRLGAMTARELVEALIDYRRVTGVPFKL